MALFSKLRIQSQSGMGKASFTVLLFNGRKSIANLRLWSHVVRRCCKWRPISQVYVKLIIIVDTHLRFGISETIIQLRGDSINFAEMLRYTCAYLHLLQTLVQPNRFCSRKARNIDPMFPKKVPCVLFLVPRKFPIINLLPHCQLRFSNW